jgi:FkbM family methyltransferase
MIFEQLSGMNPPKLPFLNKTRDFLGSSAALGGSPGQRLNLLWKQTKNLRVRMHLASYHPLAIQRVATRFGDLYFRDNFGDITNLPGVVWRNVYGCEPLAGEGAILDAGANIGLFSMLASRLNPGRPIYSFDPLPENVELVRLNCPAAKVFCVALGRECGSARLRVDRQSVMASSVGRSLETVELEFRVVPLDQIVEEEKIQKVAFLKLDTEGMEVEILSGARQALLRTSRVAMETHSPGLHAQSQELLLAAGLRVDEQHFSGATGIIFASRAGS